MRHSASRFRLPATTRAPTSHFLLPLLLSALLTACGALVSPAKSFTVDASAVGTLANITLTQADMSLASVEACCNTTADGSDPQGIIDGTTPSSATSGQFWGAYTSDKTSDAYHAHGSQHWVTIDLGQVVNNITQVEYFSLHGWKTPGGYNASWSSGSSAGDTIPNNGIVRSFEIYITKEPIQAGTPPADSLAGYGEWTALEYWANDNADSQRFLATFNSTSGRYVHFRIVSGYYNHWSGYPDVPKIAQIAELKVYTTAEPYEIPTASLTTLITKAESLRAAYLPKYGYTNAILDNWVAKAKSYLGGKPTQEMIDYVTRNLSDYIAMAASRMEENTYDRFIPKILWADDNGNHIQAHGGGVLYDPVSEKYWFYGEDRTTTGGGQPGVHAYSSEDMYNWKDEGVALPVFNNTAYNTAGWQMTEWDGDSNLNDTHKEGFIYRVNLWRKALGDWDCDGTIGDADHDGIADSGGADPDDNAYEMPADLKEEILARNLPWWDGVTDYDPETPDVVDPPRLGSEEFPSSPVVEHDGAYFTDEKTLLAAGRLPSAEEAWAAIKDYMPSGNPDLYIGESVEAKPYPGALGMDDARLAAYNALYKDEPVWRKKQIYRYWNFQTTIERPKVLYNDGKGSSGNKPYEDRDGNKYPYVMFVHIEGGVYLGNYGTARLLIAVAQKPEGPYKVLWGYKSHFVENTTSNSNGLNKGMTRDQGEFVDSDGTAYQFGSTEENRFMNIIKLGPTYTTIEGVPEFAGGNSQTEFLIHGYQNRMGVNFNWLFANQREAPAPFVHYETAGMTLDSTGALTPLDSAKRYYAVTSTSTGWFPNAQGMYRTAHGGNYILGTPGGHDKPPISSSNLSADTANNAVDGTEPTSTNYITGNGWIATQNDSTADGGDSSTVLMGHASDGSHVNKGYDGQTTHVFQLRYPKHPWGLLGFSDEAYTPTNSAVYINFDDYDKPAEYYAALDALAADAAKYGLTRPVYGERLDLDEPRAGKLVYGKYIYLSDSWDQYKNYDARYIWLPMRALAGANENSTHGRRGLRVRWMDQWRWQDFVYDLGPFADSLNPEAAMWTTVTDTPEMTAYYEMLGPTDEFTKNAGKQYPGLE